MNGAAGADEDVGGNGGSATAHPGAVQASAHAADRLRTMIADGALAPGAKLSEQALSGELGISRNTLREAFAMLAAENLVARLPNRGGFVTDPTADDVLDPTPHGSSSKPAQCCGASWTGPPWQGCARSWQLR